MRLHDLLAASALAIDVRGATDGVDDDPDVTRVDYDSRQAVAGSLFCCLPGDRADGHDFAAAAVARGAVAVLAERTVGVNVPTAIVGDARRAMGSLAAALEGWPARRLTMIGVTGTNGKTTTTSMIGAILERSGASVTTIGTLTGTFTTPEAPDLQRRLSDALADGVTHVVMEVSSHALALHRVVGCRFAVAGFTNLGLDHLDFHQTMDNYVAAKQLLFSADLADRAVINVGDEHGAQIASSTEVPVVAVDPASLSGVEVNASSHSYRWRGRTVRVPLGGMFNVANSLLAAEIAVAAGVHPDRVIDGLARLDVVPGRFEAIARGQAFDVIVDFAHTPDGLGQALAAARDACGGRVIVVFGCGGDRDPSKRPEMGRMSAHLADRVIVTSDNPRTEDPMAIVNAIIAGVPNDYRDRVMVEPDRRAAIAAAVSEARADDLVLIAGKGHERTQTIGTTAYPFDDREVVSTLLEEIMSRGQRTAHDEGHQ